MSIKPEDIITENTITPEEVALVKNVLADATSEDEKLMADLDSGKITPEPQDNITEPSMVVVNPNTGLASAFPVVDKELTEESIEGEETEESIDRSLAKLLDVDIDEICNIPNSQLDLPIDPKLISDNAKLMGIKDEEIPSLIGIIEQYRKKVKQNYYELLPGSIKSIVDKFCAESNNPTLKAKKMVTEMYLEQLIRDAGIDKIIVDMNQALNKAMNLQPVYRKALNEQQSNFENEIDKKIKVYQENIDKATDRDKVERTIETLKKVKAAFTEAYTLTDFNERLAQNKIKVKEFDIDKYARYVQEFLYKYEKDTPFIIKDISVCVPILFKNYNEVYTKRQIAKYIIAFIKFTQNMNSKDAADHTFMSNFISNIEKLSIIGTDTDGLDNEEINYTKIVSDNIEIGIRYINNITE